VRESGRGRLKKPRRSLNAANRNLGSAHYSCSGSASQRASLDDFGRSDSDEFVKDFISVCSGTRHLN
jgi:hypothetical protein